MDREETADGQELGGRSLERAKERRRQNNAQDDRNRADEDEPNRGTARQAAARPPRAGNADGTATPPDLRRS
jgi:hypothetical protein